MNIIKTIIGAGATAILAGCSMLGTVNSNVPHTSFEADLDGHKLSWDSPKDTIATNMSFTVNSNGVSFSVGYLSSLGNTNVIDATAQVVAAQGSATVETINAVNSLITNAVKSAK